MYAQETFAHNGYTIEQMVCSTHGQHQASRAEPAVPFCAAHLASDNGLDKESKHGKHGQPATQKHCTLVAARVDCIAVL